MTAIAALVAEDGSIYMGGDSAGVDESFGLSIGTEEKVWQNGEYLFGMSGSFRVAQIVRWHMELPERSDEWPNDLGWITGPIVATIRDYLEEGGALTTWQDTSTQELTDSRLLIGYKGRIFEVMSDFGVGEYVDGYAAIGCAADLVLGSLYTSARVDGLEPVQRIGIALGAAARFSAAVAAPFHVVRLETE